MFAPFVVTGLLIGSRGLRGHELFAIALGIAAGYACTLALPIPRGSRILVSIGYVAVFFLLLFIFTVQLGCSSSTTACSGRARSAATGSGRRPPSASGR